MAPTPSVGCGTTFEPTRGLDASLPRKCFGKNARSALWKRTKSNMEQLREQAAKMGLQIPLQQQNKNLRDKPKLLQSYAGYPVIPFDWYAKNHKDWLEKHSENWAGAAVDKNHFGLPPDYPEDTKGIIANPRYFPEKENPSRTEVLRRNAFVKLEASRHYMDDFDYDPKFKITPELKDYKEKVFSSGKDNPRDPAFGYYNDEKLFKKTILSRLIAEPGMSKEDPNYIPVPKEAEEEAQLIIKKMQELDREVNLKSKKTNQ